MGRVAGPLPQVTGAGAPHDHTTRRLEAFSDIVIAFTLSQLAFTLQVPRTSHELLTHPAHIVAFLSSFAFVCSLWWLHHQLFARFFYPDTPSVILNFAFLAAAVLVAYSMLLINKFDDTLVLGIYAGSLACAYSLLAIMFAKGLRDPRIELDADARQTGMQRAIRLGFGGGGLLVSVLLVALGRSANEIVAVWIAAFAVVIALGIRQRLVRRRDRSAAQTAPRT